MYGMEHGGWMFGGGFVMLLWWLLPFALVVALVMWFAKRSNATLADNEASLDILKQRYARGEIGEDEFGRVKRDLGG
ncbi:MAG: SHOCT domain-containing protein [Burkholderiales bacterium]